MSAFAAAAAVVLFAALGPGSGLAVRASEAVLPCAQATAQAYPGARVSISSDEQADVLVASAVEVTRALEGGSAIDRSDVDVARVPWVITTSEGNPAGLRSLEDLARPGLEVLMLGGPAAYEARRALAEHRPERLIETTDARALGAAPLALVPLSLAGKRERIAVDVPPILVRAAVLARSKRPDAARALVAFFASEAGQRVFSACGPPR